MIQHSSDGLSRKYLCALRAPAETQKTYSIFTRTCTFRIYTDIKVLQILNAFARLSRTQNRTLQPMHELILIALRSTIVYSHPPHCFFSLSWIQVLALFLLLRSKQINCNMIVQVYLKGYPMSNDAFHDNNAAFYLLIQNKILKKPSPFLKEESLHTNPWMTFSNAFLISKYINDLCHLSPLLDFL